MNYKLPPLATSDHPDFPAMAWLPMELAAIQKYAIAAIEAQGVPDGGQLVPVEMTHDMLRAPDYRRLVAASAGETERRYAARQKDWEAILLAAPPAPQSSRVQKWPVSQDPLTQLQVAAIISERGESPQSSVVQQEPLGFISPKQVERIVDPEGEFGAYSPMQKTPAGNFTLAIYTHPAQQANLQPISDARIAELERELAEARKDAERYRWLLDNYATGDGYDLIDRALNGGEADTQLTPAIDAAMELGAGD